jgi:hypothetical protein
MPLRDAAIYSVPERSNATWRMIWVSGADELEWRR